MTIKLYNTQSERNRITKTLTGEMSFTGTIRGESSILKPSITIQANNIVEFNYCYIPDFGRYYFIQDVVSLRVNVWELRLTVDVLMSHKSEILNSPATIAGMTSYLNGVNKYVNSDVWGTLCKDFTDVIPFQNGLLDDGEYILITAGGGV